MPERGWESITVPGAVSAWVALSRQFGKLPFALLFAPAISYADNGFHVTPIVGEVWGRGCDILKDQPGFAAMFMPGGRAPLAGEIFRSPALANSLRMIADSAGEAFYRGELAVRIADFAKAHGAALSVDDLATHEPDWCGTVAQAFGDVELHEIPPSGQGIAALIALGILRHLEIAACAVDSADALHLQIEAMKLAFADAQVYVSDPRFMRDVTAQHLLDSAYLRA